MVTSKRCGTCAYWSETCAFSEGGGPVQAICENDASQYSGRYKVAWQTCDAWSDAAPRGQRV